MSIARCGVSPAARLRCRRASATENCASRRNGSGRHHRRKGYVHRRRRRRQRQRTGWRLCRSWSEGHRWVWARGMGPGRACRILRCRRRTRRRISMLAMRRARRPSRRMLLMWAMRRRRGRRRLLTTRILHCITPRRRRVPRSQRPRRLIYARRPARTACGGRRRQIRMDDAAPTAHG